MGRPAGRRTPAANRQGTWEHWSPQALLPTFLPLPVTREGKWFPLGHQLMAAQAVCRSPSGSAQCSFCYGPCSSDTPAVGRQLQTSRDLGSQCRQLKNQPSRERWGIISPVLGQPPCEGRTQAPTSAQVTPLVQNSGPALSSQAFHPDGLGP